MAMHMICSQGISLSAFYQFKEMISPVIYLIRSKKTFIRSYNPSIKGKEQ